MKAKEIVRVGFFRAASVVIYVFVVAEFMTHIQYFFGPGPDGNGVAIPIFMMLLFMVSATVTSFLVLEPPIRLYVDGQKSDAIKLLFATIGWFVLVLFGIAGSMLAFQ